MEPKRADNTVMRHVVPMPFMISFQRDSVTRFFSKLLMARSLKLLPVPIAGALFVSKRSDARTAREVPASRCGVESRTDSA